MPTQQLSPSQWVVDVSALSNAAGNFLSLAGGTITTVVSVAAVAAVVGICVINNKDLPPWAQVALGTGTVAGVVYDPKKDQTRIHQEFQQPVDNASIATAPNSSTNTELLSAPDISVMRSQPSPPPDPEWLQDSNELDDSGEWLTPKEVAMMA
jgi:hypothetical protein